MAITDTAIRNAKSTEKPYKISDEKGMFILVHPNGSKYFRLKYRFHGKEKLMQLGVYGDVTLAQARDKRDEARKLLANGADPMVHRQSEKEAGKIMAGNSFGVISLEWCKMRESALSERHASRVNRILEKDIHPWIGTRPIAEINGPEILKVLKRLENRDAIVSAHRAKVIISQVFRYAIATGRAERDPCPDLKGALKTPTHTHYAAITDPKEAAELIRAIHSPNKCEFITQQALKLAPLVFARPGELRAAKWADIDLDKGVWTYFKTKRRVTLSKVEHIVPLSRQAIEILKELLPLTGGKEYVFYSASSKAGHLSENTLNQAIHRLGIEKGRMTSHGFRAMARTILAEELHMQPEAIEHQLSHSVPDILGAAYNRTRYLKQRHEMMQVWADYLDRLAA